MQAIIKVYNKHYIATGGCIEYSKTVFYACRWKWYQGEKRICLVDYELLVNNKKVKRLDINQCKRMLSVFMGPSLKWERQFNEIVHKMK